jgi:hypothetical protein
VALPLLNVHPLAFADQPLLCLDCHSGLDDSGFDADDKPLVVHQQGSLVEGLHCVHCYCWWGFTGQVTVGGVGPLILNDIEVGDVPPGHEVASSHGQWVYWPH